MNKIWIFNVKYEWKMTYVYDFFVISYIFDYYSNWQRVPSSLFIGLHVSKQQSYQCCKKQICLGQHSNTNEFIYKSADNKENVLHRYIIYQINFVQVLAKNTINSDAFLKQYLRWSKLLSSLTVPAAVLPAAAAFMQVWSVS